MKINWKARFKNKTFVTIFAALCISFVYQVLGLFGIVPSVSEEAITNVIGLLFNILAAAGLLVDPTTDGFYDSDRAMTYYTDHDERIEE